jgi:NAD(P)-dependent dehydrogenase (short-subunit alcohol dehydrogenase family)
VKLEGKHCLVIGASGAIGSAVCRRFASEGARLAMTYFLYEPTQLMSEVADRSNRARTYRMDAGCWAEVQRVFREVESAFGRLDVLVNCAGCYGPIGPVAQNNPEEWASALHSNVVGCFHVTRAALELMLPQQCGSIIHFSGGGAAYGRPFFSAYAASKAAIVRFVESVAAEVRHANIRLNAIAPGPVKSRMWEQLRDAGVAAGERALQELHELDQSGGVPAERAAELALFLASDSSGSLSGRLISAVHDNWNQLDSKIDALMRTDAWTLRRVQKEEE